MGLKHMTWRLILSFQWQLSSLPERRSALPEKQHNACEQTQYGTVYVVTHAKWSWTFHLRKLFAGHVFAGSRPQHQASPDQTGKEWKMGLLDHCRVHHKSEVSLNKKTALCRKKESTWWTERRLTSGKSRVCERRRCFLVRPLWTEPDKVCFVDAERSRSPCRWATPGRKVWVW